MSRGAIAILSTENLVHNIKAIKNKVFPSKVIAMVKANAYGHGIRSVTKRLDKYTDLFGVASINEAETLRDIGIIKPIILMQGVFEPSELLIASTSGFHVVFHNMKQIEWLEKSELPLPIHCWLKINTGMGRLGFNMNEAVDAFSRLSNTDKTIKPVRIISHLACAEDIEHSLNKEQINNFSNLVSSIPSQYSLCNSAAIFNFPDYYYDYVRPGLALYGVSPISKYTGHDLGLRPVMTLQTNLISIYHFKKGSNVGYGGKYVCQRDSIIGIAALGYGDGYPFCITNCTPVLIHGIECPIIGRISMDMMSIDLTDIGKPVDIGDKVILWGDGLPIEKVAKYTSTIVWNMLAGIQNRVQCIWTPQEQEILK